MSEPSDIETLWDVVSELVERIEQLEGAVFDQWTHHPRIVNMRDIAEWDDREQPTGVDP